MSRRRWTDFRSALTRGDLTSAVRLHESARDGQWLLCEARDEAGLGALHLAALYGDKQLVVWAVHAGAPLDRVAARGETALHLAARRGALESVRFLLAQGARATVRTCEEEGGENALHVCAERGHVACGLAICRKSKQLAEQAGEAAAVHQRNARGETPLQVARRLRRTEFVDMLLSEFASLRDQIAPDLSIPQHDSHALMSSAGLLRTSTRAKHRTKHRMGQVTKPPTVDAAGFLASQDSLSADSTEQQPQHGKLSAAAPPISTTPSSTFAPSTSSNSTRMSATTATSVAAPAADAPALPTAATVTDVAAFAAPVAAVATATTREQQALGRVLQVAAQSGTVDELAEAVQRWNDTYGADPGALAYQASNGYTICHEAAALNNMHAVEWIVQHQADVNVRNRKGMSPLHLAAREGHLAVCEYLAAHGADLQATTRQNRMATDLAAEKKHHHIAEYLLMRIAEQASKAAEEERARRDAGAAEEPGADTAGVGGSSRRRRRHRRPRRGGAGGARGGRSGEQQQQPPPDGEEEDEVGGKTGEEPHVAEVREWLESMALTQYLGALVDNGFDSLPALATVTAEDLDDMGFRKGHRRIFLQAQQSSLADVTVNAIPVSAVSTRHPAPSSSDEKIAASASNMTPQSSIESTPRAGLNHAPHASVARSGNGDPSSSSDGTGSASSSSSSSSSTADTRRVAAGRASPGGDSADRMDRAAPHQVNGVVDEQYMGAGALVPATGNRGTNGGLSSDGSGIGGSAENSMGGFGAEPPPPPDGSAGSSPPLPQQERQHSATQPSYKVLKYDELRMQNLIGEGSFGRVRRATWRGMEVAVKELRLDMYDMVEGSGGEGEGETGSGESGEMSSRDSEQRPSFQQSAMRKYQQELRHEAGMLARVCNHSCVIQFVGVVLTPRPCLVTKFMPHGNVEEALVLRRVQFPVTERMVLRMAAEASMGTLHLHSEGVIHRDLAARNLLIDEHYHLRVADFGFSRVKSRMSSKEYTQSDVGPIKWTAPEAMLKKCYSEASDVFSFGVVLYEMFARETPWAGINALAAAHHVCSGERMSIPNTVPGPIRDLMRQCWEEKPAGRPSMEQIMTRLSGLLHAATEADAAATTAAATTTASAQQQWQQGVVDASESESEQVQVVIPEAVAVTAVAEPDLDQLPESSTELYEQPSFVGSGRLDGSGAEEAAQAASAAAAGAFAATLLDLGPPRKDPNLSRSDSDRQDILQRQAAAAAPYVTMPTGEMSSSEFVDKQPASSSPTASPRVPTQSNP